MRTNAKLLQSQTSVADPIRDSPVAGRSLDLFEVNNSICIRVLSLS